MDKKIVSDYRDLIFTCLGARNIERFRGGLTDIVERLRTVVSDTLPSREEILAYEGRELQELSSKLFKNYFKKYL